MQINNIGFQSFCFRHFKDNAEVAQRVCDAGLNKIEICAVHADFNNIEAWKDIVALYNSKGIEIVSLGVQTFQGAEQEENWFKCAQLAGAKHISAHFKVDSYVDALPKTAALAEKYDVNVGIHCHGGYMFGGSPDVIEYLMKIGGPRIGLNMDTAWCMQIGPRQGKPLEWIKRFGDKLYGLHLKDFVFGKDAGWEDVVIGTGNLPLPELISSLDEIGFNGMTVIEYEGNIENPVPSLKACVEQLRPLTK